MKTKNKKKFGFWVLTPFLPAAVALAMAAGIIASREEAKKDLKSFWTKFYDKIVRKSKKEKFENLDPVTVSAIVTAIIGFFKDLIKSKKEGKIKPGDKLYDVASKAEVAQEAVERDVKTDIKSDLMDKIFKFAPLAIAGVVLFFVLRK